MTEPELLAALTNASVDARAVLSMLSQYAAGAGDVSFTLSNGQTFALPSVQKQAGGFSAQFSAQALQFVKDFGGAVVSQSVMRAGGLISGVTTTFSTGYTLNHAYTRDSTGRMASISVTVKDAQGNVAATATKNIARVAGLYSALS